MRYQNGKIDYSLILAVVLLLVVGLTFIYTASSAKALERFGDEAFFLKRQLLRIAIGIVVLFFAMRVDYHRILDFSPVIFWSALTLLLVVLVAPADWTLRNTRRWLDVFGFRFQPSELARFGLILMLAKVLAQPDVEIKKFSYGILPQLVLITIVCALIILEPDSSTALMIFFVAMVMLFLAGARIIHLLLLLVAGISAAFLVLISIPYQRERMMSFIATLGGDAQLGWQVKQSLISLGNGGIWGVGLGQSMQKMHWLPDPFTDFIFSIVGEELGLIGTLGVVFLFLVIMYRGFRIALVAPDREGQLLAGGITLAITLYGFMNIAVITHLVPTTGIPLPFVSYGGSSLLVNLFGIGVLLNIAYQSKHRLLRSVSELTHGRRRTKKFPFGL